MSTLVNAQVSQSKTQRSRCAHLDFDHGVLVMLLRMFFALFSLAQENTSGTEPAVLAGMAWQAAQQLTGSLRSWS